MARGALWRQMDAQPRHVATDLAKNNLSTSPGVYAWYRNGEPVYSGRAIGKDGLRGRIWSNHLKTGNDLSRSSFRRNVCEHLSIAPTSTSRLRPTVMTADQIAPVNAWIRGCQVAWIEFDLNAEAADFEKALHAEWMPPLSRR